MRKLTLATYSLTTALSVSAALAQGKVLATVNGEAITEADVLADFYDDPASFTRKSRDEITIAKNGGGAHLDLMTASYIAACWRAR